MLPEYDAIMEQVAKTMERFNEAAEGGKEGRGSKTRALEARKLSMQLTNELKDFRALSIANDKAK